MTIDKLKAGTVIIDCNSNYAIVRLCNCEAKIKHYDYMSIFLDKIKINKNEAVRVNDTLKQYTEPFCSVCN